MLVQKYKDKIITHDTQIFNMIWLIMLTFMNERESFHYNIKHITEVELDTIIGYWISKHLMFPLLYIYTLNHDSHHIKIFSIWYIKGFIERWVLFQNTRLQLCIHPSILRLCLNNKIRVKEKEKKNQNLFFNLLWQIIKKLNIIKIISK